MRKREVRIGMHVRHRAGKDMGRVTTIGPTIISGQYPDGTRWIAHHTELVPA